MKPDLLVLLKTLQLSLENGKNLSSALQLMQSIAKNNYERRIYTQIAQAIQDGMPFSVAVEKYLSPSQDIIHFLAMAEKGGAFVKTLKSVVNYMETKDRFYHESNDKIALPMIYFTLTSLVVIFVRFFAIPFHLNEASTYDPRILEAITKHLQMAQFLSDILFGGLVLLSAYFFIVMLALFNYSGILHTVAKQYASILPISSKLIAYFEKFIILSLMGEMLKNGVSLKTAIKGASTSTIIPGITKQFEGILEKLSKGKRDFWDIPFFDDIEQRLLAGAGSMVQLGDMMNQFSDRARLNALAIGSKFFRVITLFAIILMAFAVFVEFFTVVLTQVLIQQELVNTLDKM